MRRGAWLLCALVCAASFSARSESDPPVPAKPAFTARVVFPPETLGATFDHREGDAVSAPSNPTCTIDVGSQTRDAYLAAARRMFGPPVNANPGAELQVSVKSVDLEVRENAWRAVVEHTISLTPLGASFKPARWNVRAEEPIVGADERAMASAFARAADAAAAKFEQALAADPPAGWVPPSRDLRPVAVEDRAPLEGPVSFLNFGIGGVTGGDGGAPGLFARGGLVADWFVAQLTGGSWSTSFVPSGGNSAFSASEVHLDTLAFGLEVGGAFRKRGWDLRAGGGAHLLRGHANQRYRPDANAFGPDAIVETSFAFLRTVPSVFASVQYAGPLASGRLRLYAGVEARRYFGADVAFAEYGRSASIVGDSLLLFAGVEVPWRWRPRSAAGATR